MKKEIYFFVILLGMLSIFSTREVRAQRAAVNTNLVHWAVMGSPNIGVELAMGDKFTLDLGGGLNLWNFKDNKKIKHWIVQPEVRYWLCDVFNGHFFGLHAHVGQLNVGGWDIPVGRLSSLKDTRYEGYFYGAGASYGYQWVLNPRWNIEASLGGGWARMHYNEFQCSTCGAKKGEGVYDYFGITRATVSLIFFID